MTEIEKIQSIIDTASERFSSRLSVTEKRLLSEVLTLTQQLNVSNGRIASTVENLKLVNKIKAKLNQAVLNKDYLKDVSNLAKSFEGISSAQMNYFGTLTDKLPAPDKYKLMQGIAVDNTITSLTKAGIEANVTNKLADMLLKSVTSGGMYSDLVGNMNEFLTQTEKSPGALTRYAQTYANAALNQFAGQNNKLMTDDLGLEWFRYVGSNKETTREFCDLLTAKDYVHVSEIPELLKGHIDGHTCAIYEKTGLPYGMIEGTTVESFHVYNGGWNCDHKLTQVSEVSVPPLLLAKFKNSKPKYSLSKTESNTVVQKQLPEFKGSLQDFADKVLASGKASNEVKKLGMVDEAIIKDMKSKGVDLQSNELLITDKKILKYLSHPKEGKGAVIDPKRYSEIQKAINNPTHIYEDLTTKSIVYAYASKYDDKVLKVIVHPNYMLSGNTVNLVKSVGIVNCWDLQNANMFRKIK